MELRGEERCTGPMQTKGQISNTFSPHGNSRMRQSSCKTLIKGCPIKSTPPINDFNLSVCWNTRVDEDLASSAVEKKKKLSTVMWL